MRSFLLAFFFSALCSTSALADNVNEVLRLWAKQSGSWTGSIDIYSGASPDAMTIDLLTRWDATPDYKTITKIETFVAPQGQNTSVTVMFRDGETDNIVTPYFTKGQQRDYHFSVLSFSETDDENWTTVIASPDGQEIYEERPAVLRYVRTRTGDSIVNTKEVNFLDDDEDIFELRSYIRQSMTQTSPME